MSYHSMKDVINKDDQDALKNIFSTMNIIPNGQSGSIEQDSISIKIKDFDPEFYIGLWSYFRCNGKDLSNISQYIIDKYNQYLKNPSDEIYKLIEPLFEKLMNSESDMSLYVCSNIVGRDGLSFSKLNGKPFIGIIDTDKVCHEFNKNTSEKYVFIFFMK